MVDNGKIDLFLEIQSGFLINFLEHLLRRVHQHTKKDQLKNQNKMDLSSSAPPSWPKRKRELTAKHQTLEQTCPKWSTQGYITYFWPSSYSRRLLFLTFQISYNTEAQNETIRVSGKGWFNSLISAGLRPRSAGHQTLALLKLMIRRISLDHTQRRISPEGRACRLALKQTNKKAFWRSITHLLYYTAQLYIVHPWTNTYFSNFLVLLVVR